MPEQILSHGPDGPQQTLSFLDWMHIEQGTRAAEALCDWLRGVEEGHQVVTLLAAIVEDLAPIVEQIRRRAEERLGDGVLNFDATFEVTAEELEALRQAEMRLLCLGEINDTPAARFCYHFAQISLSAADEASNLATAARLGGSSPAPASAEVADDQESPAARRLREIVETISGGAASRMLFECFQETPWELFMNEEMREREADFEACLERLRELIEDTEEAGVGLVIDDDDRDAIMACRKDLDEAKTQLCIAVADGVFDEAVRLFVTGGLRR